MKTLVILGTNRNDSNTLKALEAWPSFAGSELVELHKLRIDQFVYDQSQKPDDDFLVVATKMTMADQIVFATPVYWYAMSGPMKNFFDRLTDLITTSKPLGRALAGKSTFLFATGSDEHLPEGFEVPFTRTSIYFDMKYEGVVYRCVRP